MTKQEVMEQGEQYLLHTYNRYPLVLDHGQGVYLYDNEGNKYLDFCAGIAVFALGYNNPEFNEAVKNQVDKLIHCSNYFYNEPAVEAARKLVEASGMECGPWGTRFTLTDVQTGESIPCQTRLLGEHSIANLLLCCTAAKALGMTIGEIANGVARCQPVEHRLQLIDGGAGVSIIDDAFNANPVGAQAALRVLARFPKRRIIVTPGMVELGGEEDAFNEAFGREMAGSVDVAILVGRRHTAPIRKGLLEAGFDERCLHVVGSLEESTQVLGALVRAGDTVLYENDLPDNYSEG